MAIPAVLRGRAGVREGYPGARPRAGARALLQQLRRRRVHDPGPPRAPRRQVGAVVAPRRRLRGRAPAPASRRRQHQHHRGVVAVRARRLHLPLLLRPRGRRGGGPGLEAHEARDDARGGSIGRGGRRVERWGRRRGGRRPRAREPARGGAERGGEQPARGEEPALAREAAVPVEEVEEHAARAAAAGERRRPLLHNGEAAAHPSLLHNLLLVLAAANSATGLRTKACRSGPPLFYRAAFFDPGVETGSVAGTQRRLALLLHLGTRCEGEGPARQQDRSVGPTCQCGRR